MHGVSITGASQVLLGWLDCSRCGLCKSAHTHVLGRGQLPADILFLGEGPGESEDALGEAFVGPAGRLLSRAVGNSTASCFFTNLVACRPCDGQGKPNRRPSAEEILACKPRLLLTMQEVKPKGVVLCGRLPEEVYNTMQRAGEVLPSHMLEPLYIPHPSFILRNGGDKSDEYPKYCERIRKYIERSVS